MKYKYKIIGSILIVVILAIFTVVGYYISKPASYSAEFVEVYDKNSSENKNAATIKNDKIDNVISRDDAIENIVVHIEGAVINPNTYDLKSGSRIRDLISAAGGYKDNADKTTINPAEKLKDGEYVYVYSINEPKKNIQTASTSTNVNEKTSDGKLNLNTATKEQLDTLDGIGEKTAAKIIEYREKHGAYKSVEELKNIGARIGDKTIEKLKDKLEVN